MIFGHIKSLTQARGAKQSLITKIQAFVICQSKNKGLVSRSPALWFCRRRARFLPPFLPRYTPPPSSFQIAASGKGGEAKGEEREYLPSLFVGGGVRP